MTNTDKIKSKLDPIILHSMPFLPTRTRKKKYEITRRWGDRILTLKADETLNTYDFITLCQLLKDYVLNQSRWKKTGETLENRPILARDIDIELFATEKQIQNKTINRKIIYKSIERLKSIDIILYNKKTKKEINTNYIFEIMKNDDEFYKSCKILVNQRFFDFCIERGLVIVLDRFFAYKHETTILLDVFVQSTRFTNYDENMLFEKCGLNETNLNERYKRRNLKKIFCEFNRFNNIKFEYNSSTKKWQTEKHKRAVASHKRAVASHKSARNAYGQTNLKIV